MDYLPIFLAVGGEPCLLVGGSPAAEPKARLLLRAGARLVVVATSLTPGLRELTAGDGVTWRRREFRERDLDGMRLVIVAADDDALAHAVAEAAKRRDIPVNAVDRRSLCSFILPSILDRSPLVAAVSTGGAAPILARILRARLETIIPAQYGRLARFLGDVRPEVLRRITNARLRRRFFEGVVEGPIGEQVLAGREDDAREAMTSALADYESAGSGEVYLVGAGPGDPDLLTFRALRLMQQADIVVYDRLVSNAVLDLTRRDAERIYAGKQPATTRSRSARSTTSSPGSRSTASACCGSRAGTRSSSDAAEKRSRPSRRWAFRSRWFPESPPHRDARPTRESP